MNQVSMFRLVRVLCLLAFAHIFIASPLLGQSFEHPWALGLGGGAIKYLAHPGDNPLQFQQYHPIVSLSVNKYLSNVFDFRTQAAIAPQSQFPIGQEQTEKSYLFDLNYQLAFKLNNGVILKESGLLGPYAILGIGGSYAPDHPDAYFPIGGGIKFRLGPNASFKLETIRKISLNRDYQNVEHAIAFIYNLPTSTQSVPTKPIPIDGELISEVLLPADTDLDGLVDANDACPDVAGLVKYHGCPTEVGEEKPEIPWDEPVPLEVISLNPSSEPSEPLADSPEQALPESSKPYETTKTPIEESPIAEEPPVITQLSTPKQVAPANYQTPKTPTESSQPEGELICANAKSAIFEVGPVLFALGSDELTANAQQNLDDIAHILNTCPQSRLVLKGHTDDTGNQEENLVLSIMRAYKVKYYLVYEHGISQQRIVSEGLGEAEPLASNQTSNGRSQNRRVDFNLIY